MLFVTSRVPAEGMRSVAGRTVSFDLEMNTASNSVFYCRRTAKDQYTEIGSEAFLRELKECAYEQLLFYIHGFNNLPEPDVFPRALQLQELINRELAKSPVLVVPVIWPCEAAKTVVEKYWDDQRTADQSAFAFSRVLARFLDWRDKHENTSNGVPCLKRINILAHSMGNRVLRETVAQWRKYDLPGGVPLLFRNLFLVAADIVNESLEVGKEGESLSHIARNVVVYFASDDMALRGSKVANLKNSVASRRLGHSGPEDISKTPRNVFAVDCDDVNTAYDVPRGHSYFLAGRSSKKAGVVLRHIIETLRSGRVFPQDQEQRRTILRLEK